MVRGTLLVIFTSTYTVNPNINYLLLLGGAIYVTREKFIENFQLIYVHCFYQLLEYNEHSWYDIQFQNNSAKNGGDHIYGEYMNSDTCFQQHQFIIFFFMILNLFHLIVCRTFSLMTLDLPCHYHQFRLTQHIFAYVTTMVNHNVQFWIKFM